MRGVGSVEPHGLFPLGDREAEPFGAATLAALARQSFDLGPAHWLSGLDAAELSGVIGARFRDLARHDPAQARHAVDYIGRALEPRDPARVRNRSFDLIGLARAHLITGEPDQAASLTSEALPRVSSENPGRLGRKLGDWSREAAKFSSVPAVQAARGQVTELVGPAPRP